MEKDNLSKDPAYYLTLIKIEGHRTYRVLLHNVIDGFEKEWNKGKHPKVTEKLVYRIDRLTGEMKQIEHITS